MGEVLRWAGFLVGVALVLGTGLSLFRQLVVPRGVNSRLSRVLEEAVRIATVKSAHHLSRLTRRGRARLTDTRARYEWADRLLAISGPAALFADLAVWMLLLIVGFGLMLWPFVEDGLLSSAMRESGSSFFTLGFFSTPSPGASGIDFAAAVAGLIVVALLIGYLPTLYSSFSSRETLVTMLEARAGSPAWGPEILARQQLVGLTESVGKLYDDWEQWAAELAESHANYPILMRFRSPNPYRSWIVALTAVMDSAALYLALAPESAPRQARLCLRMGFTALRDIAGMINLPFNDDPRPDDPIQLPYDDYLQGVARLRDSGFPLERTPEEAWADFRGWRVNYEELAAGLADLVDAPPAPWSGTRTHFPEVIAPRRPVDRRPDDPEGSAGRARQPSTAARTSSADRSGT